MKRKITKQSNKGMIIADAFERFIEEKRNLNRSGATIRSFQGTFKVWHLTLNHTIGVGGIVYTLIRDTVL